MKRDDLSRVLLSPVISEKSTRLAERFKQIAFKVLPGATKPEVRAAVEELFQVKVRAVRMNRMKPKKKVFRQTMGRRSGFKKAYVSLRAGYDINFAGETSQSAAGRVSKS